MSSAPIQIKEYVELAQGSYRVVGKRVSLDSIVYAYWNGSSPEEIALAFPVLTLEEVFGAITFYLANRSTIDAYLAEGEKQVESLRQQSCEASPQLYATSRRWREQKLSGAAG